MSRRGPAAVLVAAATALLPPHRREWGRAMRAELAGIDGQDRWRSALGCVAAVGRQAAALRNLLYPLLLAGLVGVTVGWTATMANLALHIGLIAEVGVLTVVAVLGRSVDSSDRSATAGRRVVCAHSD